MLTTDIAVIGGGVAGLHAAIEAAKTGAQVQLIDENTRPGGQLFKQIHKFFGSHRHYAGIRGIDIGRHLLQETENSGVEVVQDAFVFEIAGKEIGIIEHNEHFHWITAKAIILCCGASEKMITFPGWTLPGVMGAGAAQTLMNVHRVLPGRQVLMIGSGNVGLVVSYQLLQAGGSVVAVVEALPHIGGWEVHASKLRRHQVPILTSHTIQAASGTDHVEKATIIALDQQFHPIPGSEQTFVVDVVCLAVGLKPNIELPMMAGCQTMYLEELGGHVPIHDENMQSTQEDIFVAGDCAGVEEACTAIESGRLAGIAAVESIGYLSPDEAEARKSSIRQVLHELRAGPFGIQRLKAKQTLMKSARVLSQEVIT